MKFSIYFQNYNEIKEAEEYKCLYNRIGDIVPLAKNNFRINIIYNDQIVTKELLEQLKMCKKFNYSFTVSCKSFNVLKEIINNGYPAYFNFPISDWESLDNLLLIGVSDVWIDGALGFNLKSVKSKCGNVNIRVSPQISANTSLSPKFKSNANSFFIRPEDVTTYEPYIDYFDFAVDSFAEKTLYDIYKRQYFHQDLSKLIVHLNTKANNSLIPLKFVERRLNCKQLCLTGESRCTHCDLILKMSNQMEALFKK